MMAISADVVTMTPWTFLDEVDEGERSLHFNLVTLSGVLIVVSFVTQWQQPAPYGRFDTKDRNWGPRVSQRIGHVLNDGLWGVPFFILVYLRDGGSCHVVNTVFVTAWLLHFAQRGYIHPLVMRYSSSTIPLGIPITGLTLAFFAYLHAKFLAMTSYNASYIMDFRFILGSILFMVGYIINRVSDYRLRSLRKTSGVNKYYVPHGSLFRWVSCSNYLGELLEWFGWAVATWSPCGVAYFLFAASTFIPRAHHIHNWYQSTFKSYPRNRKAIIPFVF